MFKKRWQSPHRCCRSHTNDSVSRPSGIHTPKLVKSLPLEVLRSKRKKQKQQTRKRFLQRFNKKQSVSESIRSKLPGKRKSETKTRPRPAPAQHREPSKQYEPSERFVVQRFERSMRFLRTIKTVAFLQRSALLQLSHWFWRARFL